MYCLNIINFIVQFILDDESWSDEAPPIPPFNPQCLSGPEDMPQPPLYEDLQVIALRPLASENLSQPGPEDVTTFIGTSNEVSEAVGVDIWISNVKLTTFMRTKS